MVACGGGDEHGRTTSASTSSATTPLPPLLRLQIGINASSLFLDVTVPPATSDARLADAARDGARIARSDTLWEVTEPRAPEDGRHTYDWAFDDRTATALARHGIHWWAILDYAPAWASGLNELHGAPRDPAEFATYGRAFLERYGRGGRFWREHPELPELPVKDVEVWNEPDLGVFWKPTPDPVRYARLYRLTRTALHAVDPDVRAWTGGLAGGGGGDYVRAMLHADIGPVDGIALHTYRSHVDRLVRSIASRVVKPGVPYALTEFGFRTDKPTARGFALEDRRAELLPAAFQALARSGCVQYAFYFSYSTATPNFGIVPMRQGGFTPSRRALREVLDDPPLLSSPRVPCG